MNSLTRPELKEFQQALDGMADKDAVAVLLEQLKQERKAGGTSLIDEKIQLVTFRFELLETTTEPTNEAETIRAIDRLKKKMAKKHGDLDTWTPLPEYVKELQRLRDKRQAFGLAEQIKEAHAEVSASLPAPVISKPVKPSTPPTPPVPTVQVTTQPPVSQTTEEVFRITVPRALTKETLSSMAWSFIAWGIGVFLISLYTGTVSGWLVGVSGLVGALISCAIDYNKATDLFNRQLHYLRNGGQIPSRR